ncbi:hypothetical protein SAMN02910263_04161 [Butyrivibrio sp. INlla16]|nr:hypothetical protein SAMN02910263_04161 [Butyrivibrio sp. INlla16]
MVKKKLSLWEAIMYYKIIWLLLFGTVLYFTRETIFYYFINLTGYYSTQSKYV